MRPPVKFWWSHAAFPHRTQGKTAADFRVDPNAAQHARGRDYRLGPQPVHTSAPEAVPATAEPVAIPGPARTASRRAGVFPALRDALLQAAEGPADRGGRRPVERRRPVLDVDASGSLAVVASAHHAADAQLHGCTWLGPVEEMPTRPTITTQSGTRRRCPAPVATSPV